MNNEIELLSSINEGFNIKIYGKKVKDILIGESKTKLFTDTEKKMTFVKVYGSKVLDNCITLSKPFYTILPDNGTKPDGCNAFGDPNEFLMWTFPKGQSIAKLTLETDYLEKALTEVAHPNLDVNVNFQIHDFSVNGSTVSGKLKAYLHLRQPGPFGTTLFDITPVNGDYPFSLSLTPNTCVTVFSIGVASAQLCFYSQPNRICGTVDVGIDLPVVGHWGKKFDIACVNI